MKVGDFPHEAEAEGVIHAAAIAQGIEEGIVFGVYSAGSRLIEERIANRFSASRHLVREAFALLEAAGFVKRERHRGVEVVELTPDEVDELYAIRHILETSAARMTPLPASPKLIDALHDLQIRHEGALLEKDFRTVFRANIAFHGLQYSACSNGKLQKVIHDYARKVHALRAIKYDDPEYMARVVSEHHAIVAALKGNNHDLYADRVAAHLPASGIAYRQVYELRHGRPADRRTAKAV